MESIKSKSQNHYSEEFKRPVCKEYIHGEDSRRALEKKYQLGNSRLTYWLRSYGYALKKLYFTPVPIMSTPKEADLPTEESVQLSQLKKELERARFEAAAYRKMIEVAERELKIEIGKR